VGRIPKVLVFKLLLICRYLKVSQRLIEERQRVFAQTLVMRTQSVTNLAAAASAAEASVRKRPAPLTSVSE
jgi:hypothetical protein